MTDIHIRESVLTNVDERQRLIDVIAVPWNQESADEVEFGGLMLRERFLPGAFDGLEEHAGRVSVNLGHNRRDPVGKLVKVDPRHPEGLFARAKIANIPDGDKVLQLAVEDMLSPSVGYRTRSPADYRVNRSRGTVEIRHAFLDHVGLVGVPAYSGARVLEVREDASGLAPAAPLPETPNLDLELSDEVLAWARSRIEQRS